MQRDIPGSPQNNTVFTQNCYGIASSDTGDVCLAIGIKLLNLNSIQIFGRNLDGTFRTDSNIRCIMVGK